MRTITLDKFIRDLASILDDPEAKRTYVKLLRIILTEMEQLKLTSIPDVKSDILTVDDNNVIELPPEVIAPTQAGKYIDVGGVGAVYPLGQVNSGFEVVMKPVDGFECGPDDLEDTGVVFTYQNYNNDNLNLTYCNSWYGQRYGYYPERVFGLWSFDKEWSRMIFEDGYVSPGDKIIVKYTLLNSNYKVIPLDMVAMLRYKVFEQYFLNSNPSKSNMNMRMFRMEHRRYKRNRHSNFSYEDYLDAFNRGYNDGIK